MTVRGTQAAILAVGDAFLLALDSVLRAVSMDRRQLLRAFWDAGVALLLPVLLVSFFGGVLMALQTEPVVSVTGAASMFGWAVGYTYLREVGPLLVSLVFIGRTALSWAGDLAYLTVSRTSRALAFAGVNPVSYFVAPRVWASVLALPLLLAMGEIAALAGAVIYGETVTGITRAGFLESMLGGLGVGDVLLGMVKVMLFGFTGAVWACASGLRARGGEESVARAVVSAAFSGLVSMAVLDFIITRWWS